MLPTQKDEHTAPGACKPEVVPAPACSSYVKRELPQGNGDCGCWVVPCKAIGRCAQHTHTHICHKLLVLKGRGQSLKDTGETEKWVDFGPHCSGVCPTNQSASLLHSRFATERRAFAEYSDGPSRRFPQVSLAGCRCVLVTDTQAPYPGILIHIKGKVVPSLEPVFGQ